MKTYIRALSLAAALALGLHAHAQDTTLPTVDPAISSGAIAGPFITEALRSSPSLDASEHRYQAARAAIDFAGALPNPSAQITHFVESIQTRTGPQRQAIMLQQPIPWLGKLDSRKETARAQAESLWHAYAQTQLALVDTVSNQVFELAYLDKAIAIQKQNLTLLRQLEPIIQDRVRAGSPLTDLLRLQVEIGRFEDQLARQRTLRTTTAAKLEASLGRSSSPPIPTIDWHVPAPLSSSPTQWLDAIPTRSPQLALLRALDQSQDARSRLARLANRPDFSVGLNYIRTGPAMNSATPGSGDDPWAIMVGISLPVWAKANNGLARQASLEKDAIAAQIAETELQLLATARATIAQLQDSQARIQRFDTQLLPLARQSREILNSSYQSGNATILDVIDNERTLLDLETEYWRAAADTWQARWKLATLSGGTWLE
ncbi:outer membrane efflux protein [Verrucomicrobiia bacterium DG1235]|nr:outer membrane efflux protein [Verrucomicrobiae bacterium DG1235]